MNICSHWLILYGNAINNRTKSWFFYPHYIWEISKLVYKKTLPCGLSMRLACVFIQHILDNICQTELSCKLGWFPRCADKKSKISFCRWWRFLTATSVIPSGKCAFKKRCTKKMQKIQILKILRAPCILGLIL